MAALLGIVLVAAHFDSLSMPFPALGRIARVRLRGKLKIPLKQSGRSRP